MLSGREWSATPKILAILTKTGERGRAEEREAGLRRGTDKAAMEPLLWGQGLEVCTPSSHSRLWKNKHRLIKAEVSLWDTLRSSLWEATKPWLLLPSLLFSRLHIFFFWLTKQNHLKWSLMLFCHNSLFLFQKIKIKFYCVTWKGNGRRDRQMQGEEVIWFFLSPLCEF